MADVLVPTEETIAGLAEAIRQVAKQPLPQTTTGFQRALQQYLETVEAITLAPGAYRTVALEEYVTLAAQLRDVITSQIAPVLYALPITLSGCERAYWKGIGAITAGAIIAPGLGAVGEFIEGVAGIYAEC
jgi:hypothetical protein